MKAFKIIFGKRYTILGLSREERSGKRSQWAVGKERGDRSEEEHFEPV